MPVEFKDYYKILGVTPQATDEEIRKAFRALARKFHPDVAKDKKTAEDKFKDLNEAHEVLGNPESRRKYDLLGADWKTGGQPRPAPGGAGGRAGGRGQAEGYDFQFEGTGFSDFFEQFFRGRAGRSRGDSPFAADGRPEAASARGQDVQGDILISLDEAFRGAMRTISVRRNDAAGGAETESYQVRIPAGVQDGQTLRVRGKGGEGVGGGSSGDIYLRVRYAQHPEWQARGHDLIGHLDLAPWEAVLGATVSVRTIDSTVSVKVPPGTQQGHQLRIRGHGLPTGPPGRGDLYLSVTIQVPARTNKMEEKLWKQLAAESTFDPRGVGGIRPDEPKTT